MVTSLPVQQQLALYKKEYKLYENVQADFTDTVRFRRGLASACIVTCPCVSVAVPLTYILCSPCIFRHYCKDRQGCEESPLKSIGCSNKPPVNRLELCCVLFKPCWKDPPDEEEFYSLPAEKAAEEDRGRKLFLLDQEIDRLKKNILQNPEHQNMS